MSLKLFFSAATLLGCLSLSGCASAPAQQSFNHTAHNDIKTISVLETKETNVSVFMLNNPAGGFGLIGGLIAAGVQADEEKREAAVFQKEGFEPLPYFKQRLTEEMSKRGYVLVWPATQVETSKNERGAYGLRKTYVSKDNVDAQLDIDFGVLGFVAAGAGSSSPYRPTVTVAARLLSKTGKENYFTDYVFYNNVFNNAKAISINPDDRYAYPKFKDLEASGHSSVEGMKLALDTVAAKLAEQL